MTEFDLSDKREEVRKYAQRNKMMSVLIVLDEIEKQDEEFIRLLKERMQLGCGWMGERYERTNQRCTHHNLCDNCKRQIEIINELAGDKLNGK